MPVEDRGNAPQSAAAVRKPAPAKQPAYVLKRGGGFYQDDGPGDNPPENIDAIPDAVPQAETLHRFANNPYTVLGRDYVPVREVRPCAATGRASWYGRKFHGQKTSSGEPYDMYGMTAAHPTLPIPSYARVTNPANGKSVVVRVNDRGPFHADRIIDLSYTAAWKLDLIGKGSGTVTVDCIVPGQGPVLTAKPAPVQLPGGPDLQKLDETRDATGTWLQLGAFGNRDNAEALKARMGNELSGLADRLVVQPSGPLFRLQLGPWSSAAEAGAVAERIAEVLDIKPVIIRR